MHYDDCAILLQTAIYYAKNSTTLPYILQYNNWISYRIIYATGYVRYRKGHT